MVSTDKIQHNSVVHTYCAGSFLWFIMRQAAMKWYSDI